jgi:hypothetical protein
MIMIFQILIFDSGKKIAKTPLEKIFIANALSSSQTQAQMNPTMIGYWPQKSNDV